MNITWRRKFTWSPERQYYWDFCPRAYYYNYIGEWEEGMDKEKLESLKKLCSWEELYKDLLLEGIEELVTGDSVPEVKKRLRNRLEKVFQAPQDFLIPGERDVYSSSEEILGVLSQYLDNFLSLFQPSGIQGYFYRVQERIYYKGLPITVSPDFLFQHPERTIVSKLIISPPSVPQLLDLQACSLILWAEEKFGMEVENIFCDYYYLSDLRMERKKYSRPQIIELAEKIIIFAHRMLIVKGIEDFPARSEEGRCRLCKFSSICPDTDYLQ
ncbi:MAG: hypothetical protein B6D53_01845 [Candidatus Omnitrophica bacterium 4484_49]|nr:MAG: hypothetical protein B6D53_01845 [Candidatus Omnitrophica bacterium 4484_49]